LSDSEKIDEFKKLIRKHGPKKAAEIIRATGNVYDEDFTQTHKQKETFSNNTTNEIIQQIEEELAIEATSGIYGNQFELSEFGLQTTETQEFVSKDLMYAE